jgi:hypothetical protein
VHSHCHYTVQRPSPSCAEKIYCTASSFQYSAQIAVPARPPAQDEGTKRNTRDTAQCWPTSRLPPNYQSPLSPTRILGRWSTMEHIQARRLQHTPGKHTRINSRRLTRRVRLLQRPGNHFWRNRERESTPLSWLWGTSASVDRRQHRQGGRGLFCFYRGLPSFAS